MTPCMMALGGRDAPHVVAMWSPCGPHVVASGLGDGADCPAFL
jgi:hypothetical protein